MRKIVVLALLATLVGWALVRLGAGRPAPAADDPEAAAWRETIAAIERSERYGGLSIAPQRDLVPLGPDPRSQLFEFWHVPSGVRPVRDPESGVPKVTGETGMILVLIPGGTFTMGAQRDDPAGPNYDPAASDDELGTHAVTLAPFFLAKHELTQGQWLRLFGTRPSRYDTADRGGDDHPVEFVTWHDCMDTLPRAGLVLPTEAQWEYAARAGTRTPYWSGRDPGSLVGGANLGERGDWRDGVPIPMAVDGLRANGFGLHHMTGNVWEWCRDPFNTSYLWPAREGDGLRQAPYDGLRVVRGGGFDSGPATARSAFRNDLAPDDPQRNVGVRPAWRLRTSGE